MDDDESVGKRGGSSELRAEEAFIAQMKRRRSLLNLSQGELAVRLSALGENLYQQTIAKLESGQRSLKLSEADAIARALGTTVQEMLSGVFGEPPWVTQSISRDMNALEEAVAATLAELKLAQQEEQANRDRVTALRELVRQTESELSAANYAYVVSAEKRTSLADRYQHYVAELAKWREVEEKTGKRHRPRKRGEGFVPAEEPKDNVSEEQE
ncbi:helix-turn-helix transcriptional regulator [Streptomyces chartreusis]|uniref:helix-turn-helix transcriptional regulator n=1 Tax=Streptomyces chartreusis TaxID=1969 RepID=UPI003823BED8